MTAAAVDRRNSIVVVIQSRFDSFVGAVSKKRRQSADCPTERTPCCVQVVSDKQRCNASYKPAVDTSAQRRTRRGPGGSFAPKCVDVCANVPSPTPNAANQRNAERTKLLLYIAGNQASKHAPMSKGPYRCASSFTHTHTRAQNGTIWSNGGGDVGGGWRRTGGGGSSYRSTLTWISGTGTNGYGGRPAVIRNAWHMRLGRGKRCAATAKRRFVDNRLITHGRSEALFESVPA